MNLLSIFRRNRKEDRKVKVANLTPVKLSTDDDELPYIIAAQLALEGAFEPHREPDGWRGDGTYHYPSHEAPQSPVADTPSPGYGGGQSDFGSSSSSSDYSSSSSDSGSCSSSD